MDARDVNSGSHDSTAGTYQSKTSGTCALTCSLGSLASWPLGDWAIAQAQIGIFIHEHLKNSFLKILSYFQLCVSVWQLCARGCRCLQRQRLVSDPLEVELQTITSCLLGTKLRFSASTVCVPNCCTISPNPKKHFNWLSLRSQDVGSCQVCTKPWQTKVVQPVAKAGEDEG